MSLPVVLDAAGLEAFAEPRPPDRLRALLNEAWQRRRDVLVPAVVCAEVCRGVARTRAVESALARHVPAAGQRPPVEVVATDFALARQVGAILHGARAGRQDLAAAHVVAVAAAHGGALVVTGDPGDILRLGEAVPSTRLVARPPR